jgi:long-chain fatty acid transport protein
MVMTLLLDLGGLIELSERTRFGITYQSEIEPDFDGDVKISGTGPGFEADTDTEITLAQFIRVSGYHELNNQWALLGTVGWEDWSAFENVNISHRPGRPKDTTRLEGYLEVCCRSALPSGGKMAAAARFCLRHLPGGF